MKFLLKEYNTFKLNIYCSHFYRFHSMENFQKTVINSISQTNNKLILGEGSNILFRKDFNGTILKPELKGIEILAETNEDVSLKVYNGEIWDDFVRYCVEHHYYGIENLSLIPGNAGAATFQNIGAYGVEIKDVIKEVEAINIKTGKIKNFTKVDCHFNYRNSIFKSQLKDRYIIISTTICLSKTFSPTLEYSGLKEALKGQKITPDAIRNSVIKLRRKKLPDPDEIGNAGSFFKNPVVDKQRFMKLKSKFNDLKFYQLSNSQYKIPAGWMIEKCGWKGKRIGNTGTWSKQALVIVNYGNATGEEIFQVSQKIKQSVYDTFGIWLEEEVRIV